MDKKLAFFLLLLFLFYKSFSQTLVSKDITGIVAIEDDILYYSNFDSKTNEISFFKRDINKGTESIKIATYSNPNPISAVPFAMVVKNKILYVAVTNQNNLIKIEVNANSSIISIIDNNSWIPFGLAVDESNLYVTEVTALEISRFNISRLPPTLDEIISLQTRNIEPFIIVIKNNKLYFTGTDYSEPNSPHNLYMIDMLDSVRFLNKIKSNISFADAMAISDNIIYLISEFENKISMIDLSSNDLEIEELNRNNQPQIELVDGAETTSLVKYDEFLYYNTDKGLYRLNLNETLSTKKSDIQIKVPNVYPNPTFDYIKIDNLTDSPKYSLYDIFGKKILNGVIGRNKKIDLRNLNSGVYYLKLNNSFTHKVLKK